MPEAWASSQEIAVLSGESLARTVRALRHAAEAGLIEEAAQTRGNQNGQRWLYRKKEERGKP